MSVNEHFGQYLRDIRINNCLTLTQFAARIGLDSANLSKIENGKREVSPKILISVSSEFGVSLDSLKKEYFSDKFARLLFDNNCDEDTLTTCLLKFRYLKSNNIKQGQLEFKKNNYEV